MRTRKSQIWNPIRLVTSAATRLWRL